MAGPARVVFPVWSALARAGACSHVRLAALSSCATCLRGAE
jgi:hypothetical protein